MAIAVNKQEPSLVLSSHYDKLVTSNQIKDDAAQREVLAALEALLMQLSDAPGGGKLVRIFKKSASGAAGINGLYIWGNVGRGKSMLIDLFFQHAPVKKKRRVHFHAFMQEVHARIHKLRKGGRGDPVAALAKQIAVETTLLCFDELQATDVADASLLHRLFGVLFGAGVTVVSTSNHPPATLYTGGVQRERFDKFIALLQKHMQVISLSSPADYRHMQIKSLQQSYFSPLAGSEKYIDSVIERLCADRVPKRETLSVHGRKTAFMLYDQAIGRLSFHELCENALGPADYLALAKRLDTLILTGIPQLSPEQRNEAKRFVTLIDALYEHKVKLICTAAAPMEKIYSDGDGAFEFKRTVSRLAEMQSEKWITE